MHSLSNVVITKPTAFTGNPTRSRLAHGNLMKVLLIQPARKPSLPKLVFWKPLREGYSNMHRLHPLPIRVMHWINAAAIFIMIGSGWKIYNDEVIFGWLHFPEALTIGRWAQHGLEWHFFGMWILVLNGIAYVIYGLVTGRFRRMWLPVRWSDIVHTVRETLRLHLAHDDLTKYNAVQKLLYIGVVFILMLTVISGLAIWKPIQFSELLSLFGSFQNARLVHFLCMSAIVLFVLVHVILALLVPRTLLAMITGGPVVDDGKPRVPPKSPTDLTVESAP
jgi:thiosulfate reductase cytochrome b subunit